jgi:hypothetical protein
MEYLIPLLIFLFFFLVIATLIGHGIWLLLAWFFRTISGGDSHEEEFHTLPRQTPLTHACHNCAEKLNIEMKFCGRCGAHRPTLAQEAQLRELEITLRQLERLRQTGEYESDFSALKFQIAAERDRILFPHGRPQKAPAKPAAGRAPIESKPLAKPGHDRPAPAPATGPPYITPGTFAESPHKDSEPRAGDWSKDSDQAELPPPVLKPPRKPLADVLAAFMEESNVRWGEIIGGLLIIGCSTALVISLWAQISRVPVIKFLIFTTVTAALFGIGFYTAHHWKLPTTSRGILTIATLLVPLNFLAIAAVSTNTTPGVLVIGSEILAPALFLCLVYFAGRTIVTKWPHLLAAGALGSSIGQLLIRHFASYDSSPPWLIVLAAVPVLFYVGAIGWMLKLALADGEIDETEAIEIFTTLGALTFATILPFGLLLYKSASVADTMMRIAPLVALAGMPTLASGMLLWRRSTKDLVATRTAGASIAIVGMMIALAGMILAWPNPASLVPAAVFNFLLFTAIAIWLEEPRAHVIAAACLTFGYVVGFHVLAGHVPWQNLRVVSLWQVTADARTGQALIVPFVLFGLAHAWLRSRRARDAVSYLAVACGVVLISLGFLLTFGIAADGDPFRISAILTLYAVGCFWFAWRQRLAGFSWAGAVLLLGASAQACNSLFAVRFAWQASFLYFAIACLAGAIIARRFSKPETARLFLVSLETGAISGSVVAALLLMVQLIWFACEPSSIFTTRAVLLAIVFLGLTWLTDRSVFFISFQVALALALVLLTKGILQRFTWYGFLPDAWADPRALQVQGIVLGLFCFVWIALRYVVRRMIPHEHSGVWRIILDSKVAFDQVLAIVLIFAFTIVMVYASATGIGHELTNPARTFLTYDFAGHPHALMFGLGSLLLLITLVVSMVGNAFEQRHEIYVWGTVIALWGLCPLVAGRFESQVATASAGRWALASFLLIGSVVYALREKIWFGDLRVAAQLANSRGLLLALTLTPLLLLTLSRAVDAVNYVPAGGPQAGVFRSMGGVALYGVPLVIAVAALGIHAGRERSAAYVFAAGLVVNFSVTVVHIISVAGVNGPMNRVVLVNSLQLNAIAAAGVALIWLATRGWWFEDAGSSAASKVSEPEAQAAAAGTAGNPARPRKEAIERILLICQHAFAIAFLVILIVPLALHLVARPEMAGTATFAAGSFIGGLALLLTVAACLGFHKSEGRRLHFAFLAFSLLAAGALSSFRGSQIGPAQWAGLHVLLAALVLIAWLLLIARDLSQNATLTRALSAFGITLADGWGEDGELFSAGIGALAVLVALRGPLVDPTGALWSIGALLLMSALAAALNWITFRRRYLYAAGLLLNLSVSIWLIKYSREPGSLAGFVEANIIAMSLAAIVWLLLELRVRRRAGKPVTAASFHNVAVLASLAAMTMVVVVHLYEDLGGFYRTFSPALEAAALASIAASLTACLWDADAEYAVAGIYLAGLLAAATAIAHLHLTPRHAIWSLTIAAATHTLIAAALWRLREPLITFAARLKIPRRLAPEANQLTWLLTFESVLLSATVLVVSWIVVVFDERGLRSVAALAVIGQALTLGLLAEGAWRRKCQRAAAAVLLGGLVFLGWSLLMPGDDGTWLNRAVILMILMFAAVALFGAALGKFVDRESDWAAAVHDCVPGMSATGIAALAFILCTEVYYQVEFGAVQVKLWALGTVAVTLAVAVAVCIVFAVSPKHDPLALADRWRGSYVYAAEVLLVLLFMHIRLTMPWLFHGFFQRYWPLVVLLIAYAGVAISEFFKRRKIEVLATPIERTGAFLPLLPVIGFWIAASRVEYSTLLFVVGGLYGLLAILRRSFFFGLAAALAGNGGLWYLLHETSEYHFYQHPQLWLIPAAVSVLVAAHLNHKDFSETQMTGIRYMCLAAIYVSSTADIFINGVATSPWLPLVLAALSIGGVFAGMIFRIRAFLLLGSLFLLLAIATMIKYASVNFGWTWLWYVAGIVTGAAIITTFAIFEKQRADVMRLVEGFKDWRG